MERKKSSGYSRVKKTVVGKEDGRAEGRGGSSSNRGTFCAAQWVSERQSSTMSSEKKSYNTKCQRMWLSFCERSGLICLAFLMTALTPVVEGKQKQPGENRCQNR